MLSASLNKTFLSFFHCCGGSGGSSGDDDDDNEYDDARNKVQARYPRNTPQVSGLSV